MENTTDTNSDNHFSQEYEIILYFLMTASSADPIDSDFIVASLSISKHPPTELYLLLLFINTLFLNGSMPELVYKGRNHGNQRARNHCSIYL